MYEQHLTHDFWNISPAFHSLKGYIFKKSVAVRRQPFRTYWIYIPIQIESSMNLIEMTMKELPSETLNEVHLCQARIDMFSASLKIWPHLLQLLWPI